MMLGVIHSFCVHIGFLYGRMKMALCIFQVTFEGLKIVVLGESVVLVLYVVKALLTA